MDTSEAVSEDAPSPAPEDSAEISEEEENLLARLNPVQTAHAADGAPEDPAREPGLLARIWNGLVSFFRSIFFGAQAADRVPEGSDENDGRSPLAPVKTFGAAMERARELAQQMGLPVDQVTIYSMNPLEVGSGESVEINGEKTVLKPWEGRSYSSDLLFYVKGGRLSLRQVMLAPRDLESLNDLTARLVQVFDGAVVLENDVSAYGTFAVDFSGAESAKAWPSEAALLTAKTGDPVIELGQSFAAAGPGYCIYLRDPGEEARREVIRAPYLDQAGLQSVAGSFSLVGETAAQWNLEVRAQQPAPQFRMAAAQQPAPRFRMAAANGVGGGQSPASASLYAVRAGDAVIYWNPGPILQIGDVTYPAGDDQDRTGLRPNAPLKTLTRAIAAATDNNTNRIVCMQTINITAESAADIIAAGYLPYDSGAKTFQLHGALVGGTPVALSNWDQGLPIMNVSDGYNASLQDVTLQGYATDTTTREGNLMTVGLGSSLTMYKKASVAKGSYVQLEFKGTERPLPILVDSTDGTGATVHAAGVAYAPHFTGTPLVEATPNLISTGFGGNREAAGAALLSKFSLAEANTNPPSDGGDVQEQLAWRLEQNQTDNMQHQLLMVTAKEYVTGPIYLDPVRGRDTYDGVTCSFPVQTLDRAFAVLDAAMKETIAERKAAGSTMNKEALDELYPLPGPIMVCSTIEITDTQSWDWSRYGWEDYDGTSLKPELCAHEDPWTDAEGKELHEPAQFVVRVKGGSLTLGNGVRISRAKGTKPLSSRWQRNCVNVVDGGSLSLTGTAELFGAKKDEYPGAGIVAGVTANYSWNQGSSYVQKATGASVTLEESWTGSIHGLRKGVQLAGADVVMTMNGGSITGNKNDGGGSGVIVDLGAQFTMNGGSITGNDAAAGSGVAVNGRTFAEGRGPARFTMTKGRIAENVARSSTGNITGAGVGVYYGKFEMGSVGGDNSACVITQNRYSRRTDSEYDYIYGVGVSIYGCAEAKDENTFIMHSGSITDNVVKDEGTVGEKITAYGLGLYMSEVDRVLIKGGVISGNRLQHVSKDSYTIYVSGGGLYLAFKGSSSEIRNLTVENNSLNSNAYAGSGSTIFSGGGMEFFLNGKQTVLLEDCAVWGNEASGSWSSCFGGGIAARRNGYSGNYTGTGLRLKNVTLENNTTTGNGGGLWGLFTWASGMTVRNNRAGNGGGWYTPSECVTDVSQIVLSDCTFTGNTATGNGGGIYFGGSSTTPVTFTETAAGNTSIAGNTAKNGGGMYISGGSSSVYLNFDSEWKNTLSFSWETGRASNIYFHAKNTRLYLLKGRLKGSESIRVTNLTGSYEGRLYLDLSAQRFVPDTPGDTSVVLDQPNSFLYLLAAGSSATPLTVELTQKNYAAGNVLVRPANASEVRVGTLTASGAAPGGYETGVQPVSYTALKDAGASSAPGESWSDYLTVKNTPLRTQAGEEPDKGNSALTNLSLIGEGVYLDGKQGNDQNTGLSPGDAVKTWDRAAALLRQYSGKSPVEGKEEEGFQPIIWICGTVTLTNGQTVTLPQSVVGETYKQFEQQAGRTPLRATAMRLASYNKEPLFQVNHGVTATMENLRVDGNSNALVQPGNDTYNVYIYSSTGSANPGTLKVGDGVRLFNSYGSCVYMYGGVLEVSQSFTPDQVNKDTDEGYGLQISSACEKGSSRRAAVYMYGVRSWQPRVTLSGNAWVGDDGSETCSTILLASADVKLTMTGSSSLTGYNCVERASGAGTVLMQDNASMTPRSAALYNSTSTSSSVLYWTMEGSSALNASGKSLYDEPTVKSGSATPYVAPLCFTMLDQSTATGSWAFGDSKTISDVATASLKIVMGEPGGDDSPRLTIGGGSDELSMYYYGRLYLEMNASSLLQGAVFFGGLRKPKSGDAQKVSTYGILMRDNARIVSGMSYAVRLSMYRKSYYTDRDWDKTQPFSITLKDNASIQALDYPFSIYQYLTYGMSQASAWNSYTMGDDQTITLRDNARLIGSGARGAFFIDYNYGDYQLDPDEILPLSHVVLEGNASIEPAQSSQSSSSYASAALITARKVTLRGSVRVPGVGNAEFDDLTFGQGASIKAWEVELDGAATVEKAICLLDHMDSQGKLGAITLTSPISGAGGFRLHLSDAYMGQTVVKPGGTVQDAGIYLERFEKVAAKGEANNVELKAQTPNIVLDRQWNVYLSSSGNDANDGSGPAKAVRTFKRAREILKTAPGYGKGSDIIIPDTVSVQSTDKDWSFDEGGVLTSATGEVWKPLVRRQYDTVYSQPTIVVSSSAFSGDTQPLVFQNITLDAGGDRVDFSMSGSCPTTMLSISAGSSREVHLGEGAVLRNLNWDMNGQTFDKRCELGGFAAHVASGRLVLNGGVIEDFNVRNFSLNNDYPYYWDKTQHAAIVSAEDSNSVIEMKQGAIRNNSLDVRMHYSTCTESATAIVAVTDYADLYISGGEISGNVLSGENWASGIGGGYAGSTSASDRRTVGVIALSGHLSSMTMSGGAVRNNTNRLGLDPTPAAKNYSDVEGVISIGTQGTYNYLENVYSGCTFTMTGGSITGNRARHGAAFAVLNGRATLSGGTIRGNESVVPPPTGESTGWKAQYCPIYVGNVRDARLYLEGSGCVADDPIYLSRGRQIIVSSGLRQTSRLYEIYTGTGETPAGNVVVIPDGNNVLDVTPYLHNFHVHARGLVLDRGREEQQVDTQLGKRGEQACLVQMKAVFINGDTGTDPQTVSLTTPQDELGRSTGKPVRTLDAARAVGQALCYAGETASTHAAHKNHYVVYATGAVYNDLFTGTVTGGTFEKNQDETNFEFKLEGAAYLCRYTGWGLCMGNGLHENGEYCYDSLIRVHSGATATLSDITVRGRREIDGEQSNGETLVVAEAGATLNIKSDVALERNTVAGSRPSETDPGLQQPIDARGGAVRAEAGAVVVMEGGAIDSTCTAVNGGSIYLTGAENGQSAGQLTLKNAVNIGGQVYLGGQQGHDGPILVDSSFAPVSAVSIGMQGDYNQKLIAKWTDGTTVTQDMAKLFKFSTSVTALYEVLPGDTDNNGTAESLMLNLRQTLYLDPLNGNDTNDGKTPETAVRTIGRIYDMFKDESDVPGVLVFIMNPVVIEKGRRVVLSNGSVEQNGVTHYISLYSDGAEDPGFDTAQPPAIAHTGDEKVISSQLYFKRYVKTSDRPAPEGYDVDSNVDELFIVKGQLQLNGVYLDGHSNTTESSLPGQSAQGVTAQAPLVRVDPTGSVQFLSGELSQHEVDGHKYQVGNTLLTNNTNNRLKPKILPGTTNVVEGTSAGIEILSSGTDQGFEKEQRGKAVLLNTRLVNLQLGADPDGKVIIGGSDIYQNGELTVSNNTYFEGSVFLEGNGREGTTDADAKARQTSRWLGISAYGSPVANAFELLVRDSYHDRRMVRYPYSTSNIIAESEISYYMLNREVSRYFTLVNELVEPGTGEDFLGKGENTLWLRVPQAVYIDPTNGKDENNGQYPTTAVQTLKGAFDRMKGLSSKVLYVMGTIPITDESRIYPSGYSYRGGVVQLPSKNVHLEIRRYVQPDVAGSNSNYQKPGFTDGPLFQVKNKASLTIEGSVLLSGHSEPMQGGNVPPEQTVSGATKVTAPLIEVQQGGRLELNADSLTGERATLANNNNTAEAAQRMEGGAIFNAGSVILNGGVLTNNRAAAVTSAGTALTGNADGIYQSGDLTVSAYPQGLEGQGVYLASDVSQNSGGEVNFTGDHILVMDMLLKGQTGSAGGSLKYLLDMDNAAAGRQVVSYPGYSGVDSEHASYTLGNTVPDELFLVESEDSSSSLELQDWQCLDVSVPEEVFLAVHETKGRDAGAPNGAGAYTTVARADVSGPNYGVPEYTVTNNGAYDVKVTVTGLVQADFQGDTGMRLAASASALAGKDPLLYLALTASGESEADGNRFAGFRETALDKSTGMSAVLGELKPGEHGSFAFTGAANAAFIDKWRDDEFPLGSLETAETRMAYMRNKNAAGQTSLNKASAQFKLTYRIEIVPPRR